MFKSLGVILLFHDIFSIKADMGHQQEGGVSQMSTILHMLNAFVVNLSTKEERDQKSSKSCQRSLWIPKKLLIIYH